MQSYRLLDLENSTPLKHLGQNFAPFRRLSAESKESLRITLPPFLAEDERLERGLILTSRVQHAGCFVVK